MQLILTKNLGKKQINFRMSLGEIIIMKNIIMCEHIHFIYVLLKMFNSRIIGHRG